MLVRWPPSTAVCAEESRCVRQPGCRSAPWALRGRGRAGGGPAAGHPAAAANATFKAATLNIYNGLSQADFVHDLTLIAARADLVGLNEVGNRKAFLENWAADNGWWLHAPGGTNQAGEALIARKSMFDVLDRGSIFVCDTNGPGEVPPARYNNWVRYRHKASGRTVTHINAHAVASIENAGRPEDLPRTRCAEAQFQVSGIWRSTSRPRARSS
ncbi:hypothetical protein NKG94_22200 [Micromonospora sp. M12]